MSAKAKDWDSLNAHGVFSRLGAEVDVLAGLHGLRCVRAVPRIDGSVYFDLEPGAVRIDWTGQTEIGTGARQELAIASTGTDRQSLLEDLAGLLGSVLLRPEFALLRFLNRDLSCLAFDDSVADTLFSDRLVPGRSRWFDYRLADVRLGPDRRVQVFWRSGKGRRVGFEVGTSGANGGGRILQRTRLWSLALVEDDRSEAQRELLPHQVERFVGFLLSRAVHPAMVPTGLGHGGTQEGGGDREGHGEPVSVTRWGNPLQWRQFFADFEIERSGLCGIQFTDPVAYVLHGEAECIGVEPRTFTPLVGFANLPWPQTDTRSPEGSRSLFTGLVEEDAILGGGSKLQRALEAAAASPDVCFICLNNTCLPKIIGDDVRSVVRRFARADRPPILDLNTDLDTPDKTYRDLVRQALAAARSVEPGVEEAAGDLNLVGYPPGPARADLELELRQAGMRPNSWLLPEFGFRQLCSYMAGPAGLLYPHEPWWLLAEQLLAETRVPLVRAPAPYGLAGTRAWIESAVAARGLEPDKLERWLDHRLNQAEPCWRELSREAEGVSLGFVVTEAEWPRLLLPERLFGVPILAVLSEMGFRVHLLVLGDEAQRRSIEQQCGARPELAGRVQVGSFSDRADLDEAIRSSPAAAFYSEVRFDSRLTVAGKSLFHLGYFEPGLDGGLRAFRRLLQVCRWPFYRRYGRWLSPRQGAHG